MNPYRSLILLYIAFLSACGPNPERSSFTFRENSQGIELLEAGKSVYFYQREPKTLDDSLYICNNYLHPLYSTEGDVPTEEFPADHPHHRGVFWAWHQIYIDNQSVGDGWVMQNIIQDVVNIKTSVQSDIARLDLDFYWKSSVWKSGSPFVHEHTSILVHSMKAGMRIIDFEIMLNALAPGVSIGGSDNIILK